MEGCYLGSGIDDVALCETRELVFVLLLGFKVWQVGSVAGDWKVEIMSLWNKV